MECLDDLILSHPGERDPSPVPPRHDAVPALDLADHAADNPVPLPGAPQRGDPAGRDGHQEGPGSDEAERVDAEVPAETISLGAEWHLIEFDLKADGGCVR